MIGLNPSSKKGLMFANFISGIRSTMSKNKRKKIHGKKISQALAIVSIPSPAPIITTKINIAKITSSGVSIKIWVVKKSPMFRRTSAARRKTKLKNENDTTFPIHLPTTSSVTSTIVSSGNFFINIAIEHRREEFL